MLPARPSAHRPSPGPGRDDDHRGGDQPASLLDDTPVMSEIYGALIRRNPFDLFLTRRHLGFPSWISCPRWRLRSYLNPVLPPSSGSPPPRRPARPPSSPERSAGRPQQARPPRRPGRVLRKPDKWRNNRDEGGAASSAPGRRSRAPPDRR